MTLQKQAARLLRKNWKDDPHGLAHEMACILRSKDVTNQLEAAAVPPVVVEKQLAQDLSTSGTVDVVSPFVITLSQNSVLLATKNLVVSVDGGTSATVESWLETDGVSRQSESVILDVASGTYGVASHMTATPFRPGTHTIAWKVSGLDPISPGSHLVAVKTRLILVAFPLTNANIVAKL